MLEKQEAILIKKAKQCGDRISQAILGSPIPFQAEYAHSKEEVALEDSIALPRIPIREGERWAEAWENGYFRLTAAIPADWASSPVAARLDFSGEALVYDRSGMPLYSLANGSAFDKHYSKDVYRLRDSYRGGDQVELFVEAAANVLFGIDRPADPARDDPKRHGTMDAVVKHIKLCRFDPELWGLKLDLEVLIGLLEVWDRKKTMHARLLKTINEAVNAYADNPKNARRARTVLAPLFTLGKNEVQLSSISVGHAHIDTGWLWRVKESYRKSARTFASQLDLIEKYPGYVFGASQAQHYAFVKERYPRLYEKIKKAVKRGSWELQGGMWVECDCNLTSGESLVRQFLHGKNFFLDEFGVDVDNCWIPDVFGYSAAMPQIMKEAGVEFFLTQKMSWNQFNRLPYTTFKWRGIDGSEVITHFPPEDTYNAVHTPEGMVRSETNFEEKAVLDEFMTLFGIGDGGGGPKEEFIERGLRMAALPGIPKVRFGSAKDFFDRLKLKADALPVWVGELYFELHRGTLTTQGRTKRSNRMLERALIRAEHLLSCLPLVSYPAAAMDQAWKLLLLNQFHDILPGSSIKGVYDDVPVYHGKAMDLCSAAVADASAALFKHDPNSLVLFNTLSYTYDRPIELPADWRGCSVLRKDGQAVLVQMEGDVPLLLTHLRSHSFTTVTKGSAAGPSKLDDKVLTQAGLGTPVAVDDLTLENGLVKYRFDASGQLVEALDKTSGRAILAGPGNALSLYIDRPYGWDAWDIDFDYVDQQVDSARGDGPVRSIKGCLSGSLIFTLKIGESQIRQTVSLASNSTRLDFDTAVEWRELHKLLRVSFPAAVQATEATFGIQYGYIRRPTHTNTSWDMARFEGAAQRYADISTQDKGLALLSDCKYGYNARENVLGLSLLRAPTTPDPDADLGSHRFTYSIFPHQGGFVESEVLREAAMLDTPPLAIHGMDGSQRDFPFAVEGEGVSLEVVKKAEKEDVYIFRLLETRGRNASCTLSVPKGKLELARTDIMERNVKGQPAVGTRHTLSLEPFQILTLRGILR